MNSLNGEISSTLECFYYLSEVIRFSPIPSDKWLLYQRNIVLSNHTNSQNSSYLQFIRQNTKNHQAYHAFCSLKISPVEDFSIILRKINAIGLR